MMTKKKSIDRWSRRGCKMLVSKGKIYTPSDTNYEESNFVSSIRFHRDRSHPHRQISLVEDLLVLLCLGSPTKRTTLLPFHHQYQYQYQQHHVSYWQDFAQVLGQSNRHGLGSACTQFAVVSTGTVGGFRRAASPMDWRVFHRQQSSGYPIYAVGRQAVGSSSRNLGPRSFQGA